jgi:predicted ferric reductase
MSAQLWQAVTWDVARAGGLVAYLLLTLSVALGLALSLRWQRPRWPRLITNELHSFVTLLSLVFIGVHVLAVWVDPFTRFGWRDIVVPFATSYRPVWMAAGIVGTYLLLAIWISTQLRSRIGYAWWRRLHTLTFGVYLLSTIHGLGTGTDTRQPWALAMYAGSVLLVGALLIHRLLTPIGTRGHAHPRLAALTAAVLVGGIAWAATGPAHAGWSAIASHVL